MTDIVERLWVKANRPYAVEASLIAEAADEITRLRADVDKWIVKWADADASVTKLTAERDRLRKDLEATNSALTLCGYGADTHAGLLAALEAVKNLSRDNRARAEKAEAELEKAKNPSNEYGNLAENAEYISVQNSRIEMLEAELAQARAQFSETVERMADDITVLRQELAQARKALEFFANPEIYKPHPHGPAFDRRDLSFHAKSALEAISPTEAAP